MPFLMRSGLTYWRHSVVVILIFHICVGIFSFEYEPHEYCFNDTRTLKSLPIWSRGLARSCCTVFPNNFKKHAGGFFEAGVPTDPNYFYKKPIISGDIIYIATSDFPIFVDYFLKLPLESRIVLVTGKLAISTSANDDCFLCRILFARYPAITSFLIS